MTFFAESLSALSGFPDMEPCPPCDNGPRSARLWRESGQSSEGSGGREEGEVPDKPVQPGGLGNDVSQQIPSGRQAQGVQVQVIPRSASNNQVNSVTKM